MLHCCKYSALGKLRRAEKQWVSPSFIENSNSNFGSNRAALDAVDLLIGHQRIVTSHDNNELIDRKDTSVSLLPFGAVLAGFTYIISYYCNCK